MKRIYNGSENIIYSYEFVVRSYGKNVVSAQI